MEISVDFSDGRIREFNTTTFTTPELFKRMSSEAPAGRNAVTEFDLRLDLMESEGLRLDIYYHNFFDKEHDEVDMGFVADGGPVADKRRPVAVRRAAGAVRVLSEDELEGAQRIMVRECGELQVVAWRQGSGNWLINGQRFSNAARQYYSDAQTTSLNQQALMLSAYFASAWPDAGDEEIASFLGYPLEALSEVGSMEAANARAAGGWPGTESGPGEGAEGEGGPYDAEGGTDADLVVGEDADYDEDE